MANKLTKPGALSQLQHSAGIFADASIDGPEIGLLVLIVDRAKNLPNRKTIGKQDPYCAARLGKEAQKTKTDIRGGQTPRWDQELRFKVHDSPDYYQLKVSVFNDDKKTDLIGETWIDLKEIIVIGGGQSDRWQSLGYRGKYAGEIRIELTYYDNRAKAPTSGPRAKTSDPDMANDAAAGSARRKSPVKRRPLPSDPVTGETPQHVNTSSLHNAPMAIPPQMQDAIAQPHRVGPRPQPTTRAEQQQQAAKAQQEKLLYLQLQQEQLLEQQQIQQQKFEQALAEREAAAAASALSTTPPSPGEMPYQARGIEYVPQHSSSPQPLQVRSGPNSHSPSPRTSDEYHRRHGDASPQPLDYHRGQQASNQMYQSQQQLPPAPSAYQTPHVADDMPPPPPAHRSRGSSSAVQDAGYRGGFEAVPAAKPNGMRHEVLRNEAHRNAPSGYGSSDRAIGAPPQSHGPDSQQYDTSAPARQARPQTQRTGSYDSSPHRLSMQPTVEDVPDSPKAATQTIVRKSVPSRTTQTQYTSTSDKRRDSATGQYQQQPPPSQQPAPLPKQLPPHQPQQQLPPAPPHQHQSQPPPPTHTQAPPQPAPVPVHRQQPPEPQYRRAPSPQPPPPTPQHQSHYQSHSHSHSQPAPRPVEFQLPAPPSSQRQNPQHQYQSYQPPQQRGHSPIPPQHSTGRDPSPAPPSRSPQPHSPIEETSNMAMTLVPRSNFKSSQAPAIPASLVPGIDPVIAQEISELAYQKRQRERGYSTPAQPSHQMQIQASQSQALYKQPQQQQPPPHYQPNPPAHDSYHQHSQRGRSMPTNEIVPYGYTGRGPSPNPYHDGREPSPLPYDARQPSPRPYDGRGASPRPYDGREASPRPYPGREPSPNPYSGRESSPNPYSGRGASPRPYNGREPSPRPYDGRSASPNPYNGRGASPNPYNGRQPSPNPYSGRQPSPNPYSGRQPSPNPYSGRQPSPNPYSGRGASPNPYNDRGPSPNPYDGRQASPRPYDGRQASPNPYSSQGYDHRRNSAMSYDNSHQQQMVRHGDRGASPIPSPAPSPRPSPSAQYTIRRKSVSPAPALSEHRRSTSATPFGPDSYDEFNTNAAATAHKKPAEAEKIITYDGREIDPSDHLPIESWAPEPDRPKDEDGTVAATTQPGTRSRPEGPSAYPGPSGRRQLKIAPRPPAQLTYGTPTDMQQHQRPSQPPPAPGHNRLQKKANRISAAPAGGPPSYDSFTPGRPVRSQTWDYAGGGGGGGGGGGYTPGAPREPQAGPVMSGALVKMKPVSGAPPANADDWALMEEMKRIDIGAGRSRRHGGGY